MIAVTPETLDRSVEFDQPFTLSPNPLTTNAGTFRDSLDYAPGHDLGHAPSVYVNASVDEHGDMHVFGFPYMGGESTGWDFYSVGYSQQTGQLRKDPTMHPSEYVGGKLARDMIMDGGTYVVTAVEPVCYDDHTDDQGEPLGWVVLRKSDD